MKQYVGISRDHSGSMSHLAITAMKDYNDTIATIKENAYKQDIDTIVSTVKCGVGGAGKVVQDVVNSNITKLKTLTQYTTDGGSTPLFDSVGELIEILETVPDSRRDEVSFLVMVITDGAENSSKKYNGRTLSAKITELQNTDRWTFVFRVPHGSKAALVHLGIPAGNIQEWEQTEQGLRYGTVQTVNAVANYYTARSAGVRSTTSFYPDMSGVNSVSVKKNLDNISDEVEIFPVPFKDRGVDIRSFMEKHIGSNKYRVGSAFYQLTKPEKAVQANKLFALVDKRTDAVYSGEDARQLLNLPSGGTINLAPGNHGNYDIYVQSTSVNRKLMPGTNVLYWDRAR